VTGRRNPTRIASGVTYRDIITIDGPCTDPDNDMDDWHIPGTAVTDTNLEASRHCLRCASRKACHTEATANPELAIDQIRAAVAYVRVTRGVSIRPIRTCHLYGCRELFAARDNTQIYCSVTCRHTDESRKKTAA
jgi:hypothetical protein